jgi:hypothetical protein
MGYIMVERDEKMEKELLGPCGEFCGTCLYYKNERTPHCCGCGNHKGRPFWGECKVYACAAKHNVEHCGLCPEFPSDLLIGQFDPENGPKSAFVRAGLLAYRKKHGTGKYVEMVTKLKNV